MSIFSPTKKSYLTSLAMGLIAVIAFIIFIIIIYSRINAYQGQVLKTDEYLKNSETVLKIKNEVGLHGEDISLIDSFFLSSGEEPSFIEKVENLGKSLGLKVETDSVTDGKGEKGGETLDLSLKYEGRLDNCISFLKKLEELPYAVTLSGVGLSLVEGEKNVWSGGVKISVYENKL